jgi:hypothetical protein
MVDPNDWGTPAPTDDDGPEAAFDRAWAAAEREDEMARRAERDERERRNAELDDLDIVGRHSCPAGTMYVHKPGVFCPACGGEG